MEDQNTQPDTDGREPDVPLHRLVRLLRDRPGLTCTEIGETLWHGRTNMYRDRQHFARPAGKLLKVAKQKGLVVEKTIKDSSGFVWRKFFLSNTEDSRSRSNGEK